MKTEVKLDLYAQREQTIKECMFLTMTHSEECEHMTVEQIRKLADKLFRGMPAEAKAICECNNANPMRPYGDEQFHKEKKYGGVAITTAFMNSLYK